MAHRIYMIGASGTGKTTLAKAISEELKTKGYDDGSFGGTNSLPAHEAYLATVPSVLRLEGALSTQEQISLVMRSVVHL